MIDSLSNLSKTHQIALAGLVVVLVLGGTFAAATGALDSLTGEEKDAMHADNVPNETTSVMFVDSQIIDDPTTKDMANHVISKVSYQLEQESYTEFLNNTSQQTGLDWKKFDSATIFVNSTTYSSYSEETYSGVIIESSWNEENFTEAAADENEASLSEQSYLGYTLYELNYSYGTSDYIGVLSDGTYVVGSEAAVKDSLATNAGSHDAFSGPVREHFVEEEGGYIVFASTVPNETAQNSDEPYADDINVVSGSYYTKDDETVGLTVNAEFATEDAADLMKEQAEGGLANIEQRYDNKTVQTHIDNVQIGHESTTVSVTYEATTDEVNGLVDWYFEGGPYQTSDDEEEYEQNAVAGVDISQNSTHITATVVSMDSADKVYVNATSGTNQATMTTVGESQSFKHDGEGSEYVVIASYEGKQNVVMTYTVQD